MQVKRVAKPEIKKNLARKIVAQQKKSQNIWNFQEYFVSLHRQNVSFGYPGRIPRRQDFIDTALGARLHRPYSILKSIPFRGGFFYLS